jgi:predicted transcriptional regulator
LSHALMENRNGLVVDAETAYNLTRMGTIFGWRSSTV